MFAKLFFSFFPISDSQTYNIVSEEDIFMLNKQNIKNISANVYYYYCQCGRNYKLLSSLRKHMKWECGKVATFFCQHCEYKSKLNPNLLKHIRLRHKNVV